MNRKEALAVLHAIKTRAADLERELRYELDDALIDDYLNGITDRHLLGSFGKLYIRKGGDNIVINNPRAFEEWAYEHKLATRIETVEYEIADGWEEQVKVTEDGTVIDMYGEVVPGVFYQPEKVTTAISGCKPETVFPAIAEHPELLTNALFLEGGNDGEGQE